jgi:tetratricopeptide (TPR) repeat protein
VGLILAAIMVGWAIRGQGPVTIWAYWKASTAQEKLVEEDDPDGALVAADRAVSLLPDDASFRTLRAQIRQELGDWSGALEDLDKALEINPNYPDGLLQRSFVHLQLNNLDAAVADARKAREWWGNDDPRGLNHLAYTLAVANRDLKTALEDAEQAVKLTRAGRDRAAKNAKSPAGTTPPANGQSSDESAAGAGDAAAEDGDAALSSYLDTRGYVLWRLGQQAQTQSPDAAKADYERALGDLDEAIRLLERSKKATLEQLKVRQSPRQAYLERRLNASLGLMHQHRYQVYESLGQKEKAAADKEMAARRGYDPAKHGL